MKTLTYMVPCTQEVIIQRGLLPCNQGILVDPELPGTLTVTPENLVVEVTDLEAAYLLAQSTYDKHGHYLAGPWRAADIATPVAVPDVDAPDDNAEEEAEVKPKRKR